LKKILLLSDTHGYIDNKILKYCLSVDEVWHAGDIGNIKIIDKIKEIKPLRGVYGNIDNQEIRNEFPKDNKFNCEDIKVWITHIGGYPGRYSKRVSEILKSEKIDLFICGHSHILKVIYDKNYNFLHVNPGAIGKHGFHIKRTMIRLVIDGKKIEKLEVVEFNR
tara:strand:+ start:1342 stop:1833 length:492 start_codon:yes stop_codon:yes gene_type:complete